MFHFNEDMNMKKLKLCGVALLTSSVLSGCTTFMLMESTSGSNADRESTQKDSIIAFGYTKADSKNMPANELLMIGQEYIYLITHSRYDIDGKQSASNKKLQDILNVKLSKAFELSYAPYATDRNNKGFFPVRLDKDEQEFSSYFCLNYYANSALSKQEQANEQQKLDALQFKKDVDGRRFLCMSIEGKAYTKPKDMTYQYRFQTAIPVHLTVKYQGVNTNPALRVLGLPFAVAADIVTFPAQAILYVGLANADWNF